MNQQLRFVNFLNKVYAIKERNVNYHMKYKKKKSIYIRIREYKMKKMTI